VSLKIYINITLKTYTFVSSLISFTISPCRVQVSIRVCDSIHQVEGKVIKHSIQTIAIIGSTLNITSAMFGRNTAKQIVELVSRWEIEVGMVAAVFFAVFRLAVRSLF
jgi:hypothetical protein